MGPIVLIVVGLVVLGIAGYLYVKGREEPPPTPPTPPVEPDKEAEAARREYGLLLADLESRIGLAGEWEIAIEKFKAEASGLTTVAGVRAVYDRVYAEAIQAPKLQCIACKKYFLGRDALKEHLRSVHPLPSVQMMLATWDTKLCKNASSLIVQYHQLDIISDLEYNRLRDAIYRRWYYLAIYYQGYNWHTSAENFWQRTEGASKERCEAIYNEILAAGPLPEPPIPTTIDQQFASIMVYLERVSVWRNGEWLIWDKKVPSISSLTEVYPGETVHVKVTQTCTLKGRVLTAGWNEIIWT